MKNIKILLMLSMITTASSVVYSQEMKADQVKKLVEQQNYVFVAQRVSPFGRPSRDVTSSDYDVTVSKSQVVSYLPFFGRAYAAPVNPGEGGIKFTSTRFEYTRSQNNKGWQINIKPKDASDVQQLSLTVFDNGRASLEVISTNRQNISFDGYIKEGKPEEKKAF